MDNLENVLVAMKQVEISVCFSLEHPLAAVAAPVVSDVEGEPPRQ